MENPVIIFGANGIGEVALEIFNSHKVAVYGFLDDDKNLINTEINNITILGETDDDGFLKLIGKKCEAFIAIDEQSHRRKLVKMLKERRKVMPVNAVHINALIAKGASICHGNLIDAGVVISSGVSIGNHCLIHANATIDFRTKIDDFVQIGAGSTIGSQVEIGEGAFIGTGVTIVPGIKIGAKARVGAGSVVVKNVEKGSTVFGNPAQTV